MKKKTTKEILAESFMELAETNNVEKITIKDIAENCGYSSATFYRYFADKYDLMAWHHAQQMASIMEQFGKDDYSWSDAYRENIAYYKKNRKYLKNLLQHTSGYNSFIRSMSEVHYKVYETYLRERHPEMLNENNNMKIRLFCYGATNLASEWILGQIKATDEEMATAMEESFPLPLP